MTCQIVAAQQNGIHTECVLVVIKTQVKLNFFYLECCIECWVIRKMLQKMHNTSVAVKDIVL